MPIRLSLGIDFIEVEKLEKKYKLLLPSAYKNFLAAHNGLYLADKSYAMLPLDTVDDSEVSFLVLFGIQLNNNNFELDYINRFRDEIATMDKPFIIGEDPGGNFFLLNANGIDSSIYYWDRTHLHLSSEGLPSYPEQDEEGDIYTCSKNFDKFYTTILSSVEGDTRIQKEQL